MKYLFLSITLFVSGSVLAQKPSIMTVPADIYLNKNGYTKEIPTSGGESKTVPDYEELFLNDRYARTMITAISSAFQDAQYPLTDFEAQLKRLQSRSVEMSVSDRQSQQSVRDMILSQAKADIILDVDFFVESQMGAPSISFTINAIDSYTSSAIASLTQTGLPGGGTPMSVLVKEAVVQNMPAFEQKLINHFVDMKQNGRSGIVEITLSEDAPFDLEEYVGEGDKEDEIGLIIRELIKRNAVNNVYRISTSTRTTIIFEDVRVPVYDDEGLPLDVETWANRTIVRTLRRDFNLDVRRESIGLSHVRLIVMGDR